MYASRWIKCHHPVEFLAAMLNSQPLGFYSPPQLVQDAWRHDVAVEPVYVMYGEVDCTLEDLAQDPRYASACAWSVGCLRDLYVALLSQLQSFSAKASTLRGLVRFAELGAASPSRRYLRMVSRDKPVSRAMSRDRQSLTQCPISGDTQCRHVNRSSAPAAKSSRLGLSRGVRTKTWTTRR